MSVDPSKSNQDTDNTVLIQDHFGTYWGKDKKSHEIKRFTWKNRNKIQVQVINYGARITSIKVPDRKGIIEDIVLGFDDLAGYIFYQKFYFGATIGRTSDIVPNGEIKVNRDVYELAKNHGSDHYNGGVLGLDQVVWTTHISGTKVVMTHISKHLSEGYPGDLFVRVTFQLSDMNEFKINMEAFTSLPTIINLSNLTYFNLAGQYKGAEETYNEIVTINADCFLKQENGSFTGDICNVANFPFDFQVPKLLGKFMGISPGDGFKTYLCINKGIDQSECFIGRVVHSSSGRVLEIYSNQKCVCFTTANEFGNERFLSMLQLNRTRENKQKLLDSEMENKSSETDYYLTFIKSIHDKLEETLQDDKENNYEDLRSLIAKTFADEHKKAYRTPNNTPTVSSHKKSTALMDLVLTERQKEYLQGIYDAVVGMDGKNCERLRNTVRKLLKFSIAPATIPSNNSDYGHTSTSNTIKSGDNKGSLLNTKNNRSSGNKYPTYYETKDEIIGKDRTTYKVHSGIAFQTQNYPHSNKFRNFPSAILYPGDNYKHTITYKFWVRAGNPSRWIKKNRNELEKQSY